MVYDYVIPLTPTMECAAGDEAIYAFTRRDFAGDCQANKAALDAIMQSLEIAER